MGPSLTTLIFDILLRFRNYKVPLIGDIQKAFLNIEINPSDRDCLRFLWVSSLDSETQDIEIYRYNKVVFGVNSSPFLLNAVLRYHLEKFKDEDPEFVARLIEGFYVDDLVTGAEKVEEAFTLYIKARNRMKEGGFTLRKWQSSKPALLQKMEEHEGSAEKDLSSGIAKPLDQMKVISVSAKVLGIPWDMQRETIQRWSKEYLVGLREVHRGTTSRPIQVERGDIVIVEDESRKRGLWKTGIAEQSIVGKDGHTRGAKVRMASTGKSPVYLSRTIQKLYPLEIRYKDNLKDKNGMEKKLGKSLNSKEEWNNRKEGSNQKSERRVSARAEVMDAKWRTRLMLDSG